RDDVAGERDRLTEGLGERHRDRSLHVLETDAERSLALGRIRSGHGLDLRDRTAVALDLERDLALGPRLLTNIRDEVLRARDLAAVDRSHDVVDLYAGLLRR